MKLSDEDLGWLIPAPLSLPEKVTTLLERGPAMVILTRGGEGATGYLANGLEVHVPAQRVQIADTVGAGDTFNAGVLAKLSEIGALRKATLSKEYGVLPPPNMHMMRLCFWQQREYRLDKTGITILGVRYQAEHLQTYMRRKDPHMVEVRWRPKDVGAISVRLWRPALSQEV